jgi:hypothetical protein
MTFRSRSPNTMTIPEMLKLKAKARDCFLQAAAALTNPRLQDTSATVDAILFGALALVRLSQADEDGEGAERARQVLVEMKEKEQS